MTAQGERVHTKFFRAVVQKRINEGLKANEFLFPRAKTLGLRCFWEWVLHHTTGALGGGVSALTMALVVLVKIMRVSS